MSREDIVAIASRLFAVFLLVTILRSFPGAAALLAPQGEPPSFAIWAVVAVVFSAGAAICAIVWFFPLTIARRLLPVMKEPRSEKGMSASIALAVGLTLLGVWMLASAVPDAIYWAVRYLLIRRIEVENYLWGPDELASVVTTIAELALALWLVLGSSGVRRLIYRYRYGPSWDAT